MATIATLFSGGEGVGIGAEAAGLRHLWGIELDEAVAQVARNNGFNVLTGDVTKQDLSAYCRPDVLHASPPCPNFSQANQGAQELPEDIDLARETARFIEVLRPRVFTLENVWMYRKSESWGIIRRSLYDCGYWLDVAHVNAADYGVPQSRKRMIVRAKLGEMVPYLPLSETRICWLEAIEDLIPGLPETELAPWQSKRLLKGFPGTVLLSQGISRNHKGDEYPLMMRPVGEQAYTVTANRNQNGIRVFLLSTNTVDGGAPAIRHGGQPAFTVDTKAGRIRAVLVGGQFGKPADYGGDRPPQVAGIDAPAFTVTASNKGDWRAILEHGRVVAISPRCLARWQTFPDWYVLPDSHELASYIIGNAVPPLLYQKIVSGLIRES